MQEPDFLAKCVAPNLAGAALQALRARGPVVFTNGVFDVLHRGHVTYLAQARSLGGTALAIPFVSGFSTTALVQKIRQNR